MMLTLVRIDQILKYACSLDTINWANLKDQILLMQYEAGRNHSGLVWIEHRVSNVLNLMDIGEVLGLGCWSTHSSLELFGDEIYQYNCKARELDYIGSRDTIESRIILEGYRDQLSMQVGILSNPTIQESRVGTRLESFLKALGHVSPLSCKGLGLIGTSPRVHMMMVSGQSSRVYSIMKHAYEQDIIFKDRRGDLCSGLIIWKSYNLPRRLYWTLYRLEMNQQSDIYPLVPVELPLTREQTVDKTPVEHFQTLLDTWQRIMGLEKQQSGDLDNIWLIEHSQNSPSSSSSGASFRHTNGNDIAISHPETRNRSSIYLDNLTVARNILRQLAVHGCENLTDHIDQGSFGSLPLCRGGFGDVYRGNLTSGLRVAVKTPQISLNILEDNPGYLKDVAREIHTWSKCDHPNVLQFLGLAEFRGQIGMVAPWMEYGNLPRYLEKALSTDRCKLSTQTCQGVAYLHDIGIVHGDLKGENVLISGDGVAFISDFGGSLLKNRSLNIVPLEKGSCLTYRWAAPELLLQGGIGEAVESNDLTSIETRMSQASAECALNTRASDIYALGMTILVSHS
ncbi:Mitogen-activated protein kinase kinase kinase 19 [Rhizoctonia solani]|uniref:Mitogen-activated protein kinase kinase kinase 19 n=1 Tax=Rhizoctonia solani TaxID=456999 RepID=A0A0K6FRJ4_9AGAM|nr:Mitogen-activated protein kinase kinase kinase 19 [Rhizoctonia solani]